MNEPARNEWEVWCPFLEMVVCESCHRSYPQTEENRIYYGEDAFLKCPHCGFTNIGVVIKKETEGTIAEKEFDVDEKKWLEQHPEQGEQPVE